MKKHFLIVIAFAAVWSFQVGQAQITRTTGGSLGANVPTTNNNVGINYTNPQAPLDVKSEARITSFGGTNWLSIATPGAYHTITSTNNLSMIANNNAQIDFKLGGLARTTMLSNGFVGIGIASPTGPGPKLHVHEGSIMVSGGSYYGGSMITFSDDVTPNAYPNGRWGIEYVANSGLNFWQPWNPMHTSYTNYALFLKDDQKIGMGIDPTLTNAFPNGYRLYVKDGILTEKVKIAIQGTANWADFVFADDYRLAPLSEVEAFVKEYKHLPEVPSAQTLVDDGGVDVQSMLAKQMQKIEELTLYIIAQG